jgi:hypothetical protein
MSELLTSQHLNRSRAVRAKKETTMALFLNVHKLDAHEPDAFVAAWAAGAPSGIRCLKHWVKDNAIALLVEAPTEYSLRAFDRHASDVTQLFAPARRWLSLETVYLG